MTAVQDVQQETITRTTAHPSSTVSMQPSSAPKPSITIPVPTLVREGEQPLLLPEQQVTVTLGDKHWSVIQPQGIQPFAALGEKGIAWIHFPRMHVVPPPRGTGLPEPVVHYFIMYASLDRVGNDTLLDDVGFRFADIYTDEDERSLRSIVALNAIEGNRFLVTTYTLCKGCQNGGTQEFWIADPYKAGESGSLMHILSTRGTGGGYFLLWAANQRWLLWNTTDTNTDVSGVSPVTSHTFLMDLRTRSQREVMLTNASPIETMYWDGDGKLHFQTGGTQYEQTFDPVTEQVEKHTL